MPPLGVLDIVFDDIIEESADEAVLPMSGAELAAGIAVVLLSDAAVAVESAVLSVLFAGCEQPAKASPAMAARMVRVEAIGARRADVFERGI